MRKFFFGLIVLAFNINLIGQEASTGPQFRKHRFGLKGTPGVSYFGVDKPGKKNKGLGYHIGGGLNYEYSLSRNVAIASGLIFSQTTGKVEYLVPLELHYVEFLEGSEKEKTAERIHSRSYVFNSIDIPLKLKFRTPEIGYYTYYGEFGATFNVITGVYARKNLVAMVEGEAKEFLRGNESKLDASNESYFLRGGINFGGGVEWNVAGNTSLLLGLNGNLGFTNILKKNSASISYDNGDAFKRATNLNYIALQFGVQF